MVFMLQERRYDLQAQEANQQIQAMLEGLQLPIHYDFRALRATPAELAAHLEDRFRRIAAMADSQREYLQGVIEFYQTRTGTKMTIAAERLAVIAAVTLPITALSSIMGMNVIVNDSTHWGLLWLLLGIMSVMSLTLLIWARRKGWW